MTATSSTTKRHDDGNSRHDDGDPRSWDGGGDHRVTGVVNALDCGDGRGIAGAMTTTMMGGPGDVNVEAVDRFARAGKL
jgi:hypothetical protein